MINSNPAILIHLTGSETQLISAFLTKTIEQGINFEFLNPKLLGEKWQNVISFQPNLVDIKPNMSQVMDLLSKIIHRFDSEFAWQKKEETGNVDQALGQYSLQELVEIAFKLNKSTKFTVKQLEYKGILYKGQLTILRELKAAYTKLQIEQTISLLHSNFFILKQDSNAVFALLSISSNQLSALETIFVETGINWQVHSWLQPIVTWNSSNSKLNLLIQDYYIPEAKTLAGLNLFVVFWSILVGYIMADILAGLVFVSLSLLFKLLPKSKLMWLIARTQLFYCGLSAIIFGLIFGQFAGRSVLNLGFLSFFRNFQLLEFGNSSSLLPLNQLLSQQLPNLNWLDFNFFFTLFLACLITFLALIIKIWNQRILGLRSLVNTLCWVAIPIFALVSVYYQLWPLILAPVILLYVFQPKPQLKNFLFGRNSIYQLIVLFFRLCSWFSLFGLSIFSFWFQAKVTLLSNFYLTLIVQILFYSIFGLAIYQLTFRLLVGSFVGIWQNYQSRQLKPEIKLKYWKF
jgi:hypothetical protein